MTHSDTLFETAYAAAPRNAARVLPIDRKPMVKRLVATLTAGVTALSLMIASAVPAHADRRSDNLAKAVVAAIAIGAIVNSIDKGRAQPAPVQPAPDPVRSRRAVVPSVCAIEVQGARRNFIAYPERCLRREGFRAHLPQHCAISLRDHRRTFVAYGERCLKEAGFRIGGGREDRGRRGDWRGRGGDGY